MFDLHDPPAGTRMHVSSTGRGARAWWPAFPRGRSLALWMAAAVAAVGFGTAATIAAGLDASAWSARGVVVLATICLVTSALIALSFRYRSLMVESVAVESDTLTCGRPFARGAFARHARDHLASPMPRGAVSIGGTFSQLRMLWSGRHEVVISREGVTEIRLEGKGKFGHVAIRTGETDLDIGRQLSQDDRRWLCDALQKWLEQ